MRAVTGKAASPHPWLIACMREDEGSLLVCVAIEAEFIAVDNEHLMAFTAVRVMAIHTLHAGAWIILVDGMMAELRKVQLLGFVACQAEAVGILAQIMLVGLQVRIMAIDAGHSGLCMWSSLVVGHICIGFVTDQTGLIYFIRARHPECADSGPAPPVIATWAMTAFAATLILLIHIKISQAMHGLAPFLTICGMATETNPGTDEVRIAGRLKKSRVFFLAAGVQIVVDFTAVNITVTTGGPAGKHRIVL